MTSLHPDRFNPATTTKKRGVIWHVNVGPDNSAGSLLHLLGLPGDRPNGTGGVYGSGYHCVTLNDPKATYVEVADATMAPFAAPPVNDSFLHLCIPGQAEQTRAQWLDPASFSGIRAGAKYSVVQSRLHGFPLAKLSPAQLAAGQGGLAGHVDVRDAWGKTNHWDPGPGFPWDVVLAEIRKITHPVVALGILSRGSKGPQVLQLQRDLITFGFRTAAPSSVYGKATERHVLRFQRQMKVKENGYGPRTARKMRELKSFFALIG